MERSSSSTDPMVAQSIERLKTEVPELCMWVYTAKGINRGSGVPETFENVWGTMKLMAQMLANEPSEQILPSLSQRRGWRPSFIAKRSEMEIAFAQADELRKKVEDAVNELQLVSNDLDRVLNQVTFKYDNALRQVSELANLAAAGKYHPMDLGSLEKQVSEEVVYMSEDEDEYGHKPEPPAETDSEESDSESDSDESRYGSDGNTMGLLTSSRIDETDSESGTSDSDSDSEGGYTSDSSASY